MGYTLFQSSLSIPLIMSLSFLRPMALPRIATFKHFLGIAKASTSAIPSTTSTTTSTSTPSPPPQSTSTTASASASASPSSPIPPTAPQALTKSYQISRTNTHNLPVYLLSKRGGNLKQTRIRRIEGDIKVLREDLQAALGVVDDKEVAINPVSRQIIVKVCSGSLPSFFSRSLCVCFGMAGADGLGL